MKIVEPYAKILDCLDKSDGIQLLRKIEFAARISHASEEQQTTDSWDRFLRAVVIGHGDWSVVEHASVSVDFKVDRGITHELVRHRLFSFTQSSTRFINYAKKMEPEFVRPEFAQKPDALGIAIEPNSTDAWDFAVNVCEDSYRKILAAGFTPQIARSVFPNALASRILITGNLRNWRHFLIMRTTRESHPQMRQVTIPLLEQFKERIPILFEDIEPMAKQSEAIRSGR